MKERQKTLELDGKAFLQNQTKVNPTPQHHGTAEASQSPHLNSLHTLRLLLSLLKTCPRPHQWRSTTCYGSSLPKSYSIKRNLSKIGCQK
ncbi:hypothetical protein M408DRAFT_254828 [Serendipita vermifera MAFF 305830]|uniref:Uncharacterized protein n=1 Tax=Serendipita vermifera MAFF 305830 TaxID=933852 RepID=A0A0C3B2W8_SERVB|nr:hypothetical protein M408DRAFT_254828 [Serendipita vermifera MAFF 305830]